MKFGTRRLPVLMLLCWALLGALVFGVPAAADDSLTLRVGIYDNSPKIFTDEGGNAAGFWPEIIEYIAAEEGWQIEYVPGSWAEGLSRLADNEIDIMPDVAYTEERAELYTFSDEVVYVSWSRVYTREGAEIESILDLEGKDVAVMQGSVNVEGPEGIKTLVSSFDVDCTFIEADSYIQVFELVASGEADAGVASKDFGYQHEEEFDLVPTGIIFQPSSLYFAFPQDASLTPYLISVIDSHIQALRADEDSVYYQALATWMGVELAGEAVIPTWVRWTLIGVGGLALLLGGIALLLRFHIRMRTRALREEMAQRQKIEEALEKERDRAQLYLDISAVMFVVIGKDKRVSLVNQRGCQVLGYREEEVVGKNWFRGFLPERMRGEVEAGFGKMMAGEVKPMEYFENPVLTRGGEERMIAWHNTIIRDDDGQVVGTLSSGEDITERKRAEEKVMHLNLVLKALRGVNQLITREKDRDRMIQEACKILVDTRGYDRAFIVLVDENKRPVSESAAGLLGETSFLEQMKAGDYPQCYKELESQKSPFLALDCPGISHQGCVLAKEHSHRGVYRCRLEADGRVYGILGVTLPSAMFADEEEMSLFQELGGDLAFALKVIDEEEKRQQAEGELRQSEASLAEAQRVAHIGSWVLDIVSNTLTWSDEVYRIFGLEPQQFGATYEAFLDNIHPDDREMANKAYTDSVKNRTPYDIVHRLLLKDGTVKYVNERCATFYDDEGKPLRSMGTVQDITEHQQAEKALRESEARYRGVIEGAHDMIQSVGLDGRIIFVNKAWRETLGYTEDELPGLSLFDIIHPDSMEHCKKMFARVMKGKPVHSVEAIFLTKDGREVMVEGNAAPRYIGDEVVATQGIFRDVTERKRMDHDLKERMKELRCLYNIEMIGDNSDLSLDEIYQRVVEQIPPGWQYPEVTAAKLAIRGKIFETKNYRDSQWKQSADVKVYGDKVGGVEVVYLEEKPESDEGPFLKEERQLINSVADQLARITESRRVQEALRKSEERLSLAVEGTNLGLWDWMVQTGEVVFNERWAEIVGYTLEELAPVDINTWTNLVHPDDLKESDELLKKHFAGESDYYECEARMKHKNGEWVWIFDKGKVVEWDKDGKPVRMTGTHLDITERKQVDEALKESEEKYKHLVEATTDVIWEVDEKGLYTFISPKVRDILGYTVSEVVGKKRTLDLLPREEAQKWLETFKEINAHRRSFFGFEINHLHKNGATVVFEVSGIPFFDSNGDFKGFVGVDRDITERKQMQQQLFITDRLASVGELASGIAHELNNPLTGVIGFSQLIMDKDIPDDIREDVDMVYREALRAAQVVKNLLTFARKHPPEKQMLNINSVIEQVMELRAYEQRVNNIKVDARLAADLPEVMADYFQLQQVFLNIIINAEFFMKEAHNGGTLTITTGKVDKRVRAVFADDGPGIAEASLGHLFDPFFTTKEVGKGTGLGLSICHGIIAEHGGRIHAESKPGEGATFTVELPTGRRRLAEGAK